MVMKILNDTMFYYEKFALFTSYLNKLSGDELRVLHKINGSLLCSGRYEVPPTNAYPVTSIQPAAEPLTADHQYEDTGKNFYLEEGRKCCTT